MKYYISTIADVVCEEGNGDWEKLSYIDRSAPLAVANGMGIEIAEFCISDNMDNSFDTVLPHVQKHAEMTRDKVLHAPYNELFPMAIEPLMVEVAHRRYVQTLEYCRRFGASKMIVHANYVKDMYYPGWFINRHIDFWKKLLKEREDDVIICVENVQEDDPQLILGILKGVDDPRLKMCLDVGHANLSGIAPIDWLKVCAPYISHYHLHNNYGLPKEGRRSLGDRHLSLGDGNIDTKALLTLAEELTSNATASIECYEPESSVQWLKDNGFIQSI